MRIIVFATHKGGCGKSSLATSLAVAARDAGESVAIFDLDPKNCASRWGSKRMDRTLPVRPLASARLPRALNGASKRKVTLFLLNQCPPRSQSRRIQKCIAALEAAGPLVAPQIGTSQKFLEAAEKGKGVTEIDRKGRAAEEIRSLWFAIKRSL
jgi:chromosome partitioning protein